MYKVTKIKIVSEYSTDSFIENNCLLIIPHFWKQWQQSWIWSKYDLWFHFFSGCYEKNQTVNLGLYFSAKYVGCEGARCYLSFCNKEWYFFDIETMPVKIILILRDLLKWSISMIGYLTRRVWIDPFRINVLCEH